MNFDPVIIQSFVESVQNFNRLLCTKTRFTN